MREPTSEELRILVVVPEDALFERLMGLLRQLLPPPPSVLRCATLLEAVEIWEGPAPSVCLLDARQASEGGSILLERWSDAAPPVLLIGDQDAEPSDAVPGVVERVAVTDLCPPLLSYLIRGALRNAALHQRLRLEQRERARALVELERSRTQLDRLGRHLPGAVWVVNERLRVLSAAGHSFLLLGLNPESLVGSLLPDLLHEAPDSTGGLVEAHRAAVNGQACDRTMAWRGRRFQVHLEPLETETGRGALGVALDLTDRHRAEKNLTALVSRAQCILWDAEVLETGGELPVWRQRVFDEDAAYRFFPVDSAPGEAYAQAWHRSRLPEDRERTDAYGAAATRANRSYQQEYRCRAVDGSIRWFNEDVQVEPIVAGHWRAVGVCTDITDRKRSEETLQKSDERFRELAENVDQAFWVREPNQAGFHYLSPVFARIWGRPTDQLLEDASLFHETIPAEDRELVQRNLERLLTGEPVTVVHRIQWPDGSHRWVECRGFPVCDDSGLLVRTVGVVKDITEQLERAASLRLQQTVVESVSEAVVIADAQRPDLPVVYANPAFHRLTGYGPEEVLGRNCRYLRGADTDPGALAEVRRALKEERAVRVELKNYRKDGTPFWNSLSLSPIRDEAGVVTHYAGFQTDVTQRRLLEAQLNQAQRMEALGRLAGGIAHDFNNVLSVINGYTELLQRLSPAEGSMQSSLAEIVRAGERAAGLTRQLLALSRRQAMEPKPLDLRVALQEIARMLQRVIGEDVALVLEMPSHSLWVRADPAQLEQVLLNLAINSRHAMPDGGTLTFGLAAVELDLADGQLMGLCPGAYVQVWVTDTGTGIPEDIQSHIFEPFFTTKPEGVGTGLGLASVFGSVAQSAGHIGLESRLGVGTTFRIHLPLTDQRPAPPAVPEPAPLESCGCILLVEDQEPVRRVVRAMLEGAGYRVLAVSDGEKALTVLREDGDCFDLLLTDLVLPGTVSGRRLARALRSSRPGLPVLYISGYTQEAETLSAEPLSDFVGKPFNAAALLGAVHRLLERARTENGAGAV